jgi:hypothetical protein
MAPERSRPGSQLPPTAHAAQTGAVPTPDTAPTAVASSDFSVPAAEVWAFRLDFAHLPEYNPDVTGVERVEDGTGVAGALGRGARYTFDLADPRQAGRTHPVELWTVEVVEPTLVAAGMKGGAEAYEEFVVQAGPGGGSRATLTLWVTMPDGLAPETVDAMAAGGQRQIEKELRLMEEVLEGRASGLSVH